jgi:hypothetical protein
MRTRILIIFILLFLLGHMNVVYSAFSPADSSWTGSTVKEIDIKSYDFRVEVIEYEGTPLDSFTTIYQDKYGSLATFSDGGQLLFTSKSIFINVTKGNVALNFMANDGGIVTLAADAGSSIEVEPDSFTITSSITNTNEVLVLFDKAEIFIYPGQRAQMIVIDIRPLNESYCFNQNMNGLIPVVIFGSAYLDVNSVEIGSLFLEGPDVTSRAIENNKAIVDYVNEDEYLDLVVEFQANNKCLSSDSSYATLKGNLSDGTIINGIDDIHIAP